MTKLTLSTTTEAGVEFGYRTVRDGVESVEWVDGDGDLRDYRPDKGGGYIPGCFTPRPDDAELAILLNSAAANGSTLVERSVSAAEVTALPEGHVFGTFSGEVLESEAQSDGSRIVKLRVR